MARLKKLNIFRSEKKTIILGIHGLGNKPSHDVLTKWWISSLKEGLRKIPGSQKRFSFRMVYWADIMYLNPLDPNIRDSNHELHIEEPYIAEPIPSPAIQNTFWHRAKLMLETVKEVIFLSENGLINIKILFKIMLRRSFKDLAAYYGEDDPQDDHEKINLVKTTIRKRLNDLLRKHSDKRIMIIAHSMGSIIAYDVLSELKDEVEVEMFLTIGSPLGLPALKQKIKEEFYPELPNKAIIPSPRNIRYWFNFFDPEDHFAIFNELAKYYGNSERMVRPRDIKVDNDYKDWVTNNAHKSFGYLRTPELAQSIANFLRPTKVSLIKHLFKK